MKTPRADYTLEFKKEAVRLVQGGQRQSEAAASLGISGQTLGNWIKADTAGRLTERKALKAVSDEQMEISRLKAELAKTRMERDILKNQSRDERACGHRNGFGVGWRRKGAAGSFLVALDPVKKHGPWVSARLGLATPPGDPV